MVSKCQRGEASSKKHISTWVGQVSENCNLGRASSSDSVLPATLAREIAVAVEMAGATLVLQRLRIWCCCSTWAARLRKALIVMGDRRLAGAVRFLISPDFLWLRCFLAIG